MPKGSFGFQPSRDHPDVVASPPVIFAGVLALGLILDWQWPTAFLPERWSFQAGFFLIFVAVNLKLFAVRELVRSKTNLNVYKPATGLVTSGLYSWSRNPIYLGIVLLNVGIACFLNSLWTLLLTPVLVALLQKGVIEPEEAYLERKFAATYLRYRAGVRRWF